MSGPDDQKSSDIMVRIIKIANRLKMKLGSEYEDGMSGQIPADAILEADALIATLCEECPNAIGGYMEQLIERWREMRDMPDSPARDAISEEVFTLAHEIKDIAAMCEYELTAYFAESLRDFVAKTELDLEAKRVIVQAHVDALKTIQKQGFKDTAGPLADELKEAVKIAIEKFS